ncbi:MAG: glucose 1-dehydrogenase [Hyphomicrobiales bacterium]|nr:glucose 1-dehydrogenase [Hyphomicrobiales bacterium]MBV8825325.1 glucose 1-dehydrogenase [Hyphomicrobiales bacterium]MBV9429040.1 glucose 1-dehydrogenase [Bradyrhizobiaceae bacterium]
MVSNSPLTGKAALVTGAGSGIGRAIAETFAKAGAAVACVDVDQAQAKAVAQSIAQSGGRALALTCDVSRESDTQAAAAAARDELGPVRVLVNAAAVIDKNATVLELDPDDWDRIFAVNVKGAFLMSRAVLPMMIAAGGGSIIHIASQLGRVGAPHRAAYCSTKGAVIQLAKAMAVDHAKDNVRVNALSPGAVATRRMLHRYGNMDEARREAGPKHLLNRLGEPEEIAQAALFLASDGASFMTGADLLVDGGYTTV